MTAPKPKPEQQGFPDVDVMTQDAAPKTAKTTARKRARPKGRPSVEVQVTAILTVMGTGWAAADDVCGNVFLEQVPDLARALNLWAQQDKRLYDWIAGTTAASGPLSFAIAAMPIAQAVAVHHLSPVIARRRELAAAREVDDEARLRDIEDYVNEVAV